MKYHIVQLGCQMNLSDSERIAKVFSSMGFSETEAEDEADILGVVACSVRQSAIDRAYARIARWNKWKSRKSILTFVSGCILPEDREKFLERFDLLFSINELPQLPFMIAQYGVPSSFSQTQGLEAPVLPGSTSLDSSRPAGPLWLRQSEGPTVTLETTYHETGRVLVDKAEKTRRLSGLKALSIMQDQLGQSGGPSKVVQESLIANNDERRDPMGGFWHIEPKYSSTFDASIPIQNGCDKFCTFCAVPYTRGREISRPSQEIIDEVRRLVEKNYTSITLLGQNVNSYGLDRPGQELSFAQLLEEIGKIGDETQKNFWVYFTSPHPRDMTDEVLEVIAKYRVLAKWIHLPLQSGDDKLLLKMNRNHGMTQYRKVAQSVRRILPEAALFTDIIVGFTGETEEMFENSKKAMYEFSYNMAFIAQYSPRPGAASSRWDDDISNETKAERWAILTKVLHETGAKWVQAQKGKVLKVLVNRPSPDEGFVYGLTEGRINVKARAPRGLDQKSLLGTFISVHITGGKALSLEGDLV